MQYFAALQHGYSFVTVHCIALNMSFKSFEASVLWPKPNDKKKDTAESPK